MKGRGGKQTAGKRCRRSMSEENEDGLNIEERQDAIMLVSRMRRLHAFQRIPPPTHLNIFKVTTYPGCVTFMTTSCFEKH